DILVIESCLWDAFIFSHLKTNLLSCINPITRTITHYLTVSLSFADFETQLLCLDSKALYHLTTLDIRRELTEPWMTHNTLCIVIQLFKTVSVAVSVLTLTFISVDRWYAICFPLKFKSTTSRAKTAIIIIWLVALAFGEYI
ncbi:hypothetical protein L9F63_007889, partial [Diploptera punctata]